MPLRHMPIVGILKATNRAPTTHFLVEYILRYHYSYARKIPIAYINRLNSKWPRLLPSVIEKRKSKISELENNNNSFRSRSANATVRTSPSHFPGIEV